MSFDWSQYLDVARELAEQAKTASPPLQEARYRASISRAYYAVFCKARYHLHHYDKIHEPKSLLDPSGQHISAHKYVIMTFLNSNDQDRIDIGEKLDCMLRTRKIADYKFDDPILRNLPCTVQATLKSAKEALSTLNRLQKK